MQGATQTISISSAYYRARYHDSNVGRFFSEDSIGFKGGINFFTYVKNRPTSLMDPSGKLSIGSGFSPQCYAKLLAAINTLKDRIKTIPSCNCWFMSNGLKAPLDVFLQNPALTVKFDPSGNSAPGEQNTLAYVEAGGNPFEVFLVPRGCDSLPDQIAADLTHEIAHIYLGQNSSYYRNHPLAEREHNLARQAQVACGFPAFQAAGTTITVH